MEPADAKKQPTGESTALATTAGAVVSDDMRTSVQRIPCYILTPKNPLVTGSELSSMVALLLLYFVLPFEIAFIDAPNVPDPLAGIYIFNRVIDCIFLVDLFLTFFVAFPKHIVSDDEDDAVEQHAEAALAPGAAAAKQQQTVQLECRLSRIFLRYLQGWLPLDAFSFLPSAFDVYFAVAGAAASSERQQMSVDAGGGPGGGDMAAMRAARTLKLVKFMRMARMLKILRLLRLTKLLKFLQEDGKAKEALDYLAIALAERRRTLRLIRLLFGTLVISHLLACLLGVSGTFGDEKLDSWWGTHGYCWVRTPDLEPSTCTAPFRCSRILPSDPVRAA